MMVVDVQLQPTFRAGTPRVLFEGKFAAGYDVSPDGQRFVMLQSEEQQQTTKRELQITLNWFEDLRRRVPAGKK